MPDQQVFHPALIARSYRDLNPGKFEDIDDKTLIDAIRDVDPATYKLIDPQLIGAELLKPPYAPPPARPLPTTPVPHSTFDTLAEAGLRIAPTIAGATAGTFLGPPGVGTAVGGAGGAALGEAAAQWYEQTFGNRPGFSPGSIALEAGLGALNPAARGSTTLARIGSQALFGAGFGAAGTTGRSLIEEGHLPTAAEVAVNTGLGAAFGGAMHAGVEGLGAVARMAPNMGEGTGALPTEIPPPPGPADQLPLAAAASQVYEAEEARLAAGLQAVYGPGARPSTVSDFHTALQSKDYLEQLAKLNQPPLAIPPVQPDLATTPYAGAPPPLMLSEQGGLSAQAPPESFRAYPPGVNPSIEAVGTQGRADRIIGGRDVGTVPPASPTLQEIVDRIAQGQGEPGAPRLVLEPPAEPEAGAPPSLISRLRPSPEGPIQQLPRVGGRPATEEQPRIPGTNQPAPLDRVYATGPNAGPRRPGELHGQPRMVRRRVQTDNTFRFEQAPSTLPAEDPGTYPPEVRREMARMLYELQEFPYERIPGGTTQGQLAALAEETGSTSEAVAEARRRGASAGGAIPGAPVYHDILRLANGARAHASREDVIQDLRAALLQGKGGHLSDAAAQVARERVAQEVRGGLTSEGYKAGSFTGPQGTRRSGYPIISQPGAGDALIGWEDEAGTRALPDQDLDEFQRAARDTEDGDLLAAVRLDQSGEVSGEAAQPYFAAVREEAVRRGLIRLEQPGLPMEGPGGAKGPTLFDFEGGVGEPPPGLGVSARRHAELLQKLGGGTQADRDALGLPPPAAPPPAAPTGIPGEFQPGLPATEGVRVEDRPMPPVAEAPFALASPPVQPGKIGARTPPPLLRRLLEEDGVLILDVPAGDRDGLKKWLTRQEKDHGGDAWFSRVEEHLSNGEWDRAWKAAASASVRSYANAYRDAKSPQEEAILSRAVQGTPLQSDINTGIVAGARQRAQVGEAPPVRDFPPSRRVTQADAARGRAELGPAGIIVPGPPQRPLSSAAPALRGGLLDKNVVKLILESTAAEEISTVPGNRDTFLRLYRQVGEQVYKGQNLKLLREAGVSIPPEGLAQHLNHTISEWGRGLQLLQQFAQANKTTLEEAAQQMSMGGALRGLLKGEAPPRFVGAGGREVSPTGRTRTLDAITTDTNVYEQAMVANTLQKAAPVGPLRALHDASYAFMLSKWNTAVRNYVTFAGRYTVDSLDHALTIPLAALSGDTETATLSTALLKERGLTPTRTGTAPQFRGSWGDTLQEVHNFTLDSLNQLKPDDARRSIRLLLDLPEAAAQYLGSTTGEDLSTGFSNTPVLRYLTNPRLQRMLTTFNRTQEFSARATVFDSTMRALLRARDLEPTTILQQPIDQIAEAVGGKPQLDDLLYTATAQALEATFAGRVSKDSLPGALIKFVNQAWPLKLGIPFPKFNFSSAPRWIYDHSPAALLDLVRFPLDAAGITAPEGTAAGGRLFRGVRAQTIERKTLPNVALQIGQAEKAQGTALAELLSTQREMNIRNRQVTRLTTRAQAGLPDVQTALDQATELRDQLGRRRERLKSTMQQERTVVGDLKSEQKRLLGVLADARGINAPNFSQYLARIGTGTVGMLGAAWVVRSQPGAEGTRWYEYRVNRQGKDPIVLDFRPFAPFAQYLFVADVLHDFNQHTNWDAYHQQIANSGGRFAGPIDRSQALWDNYEGKYTGEELGAQFAQAFLSISRAAGTTLTITDLLTQNGWPGPREAADAIIGTMGQFLSRFTTPGGMARDVIGQFDPEEAKIRTPPRTTLEEMGRPLAGPLANVPYASQLIPETVSQTTGKPIATEYPLLRALAGIGTAPRDFVTEEVRRVGVPGSSVFIRETGDVGLDRMVAESYSKILQDELPSVLEDPSYTALGTPARQRDYLQRYIFPALKRAALGETRSLMGEERFQAATVTGETARKKARQMRLLEDLERAEPGIPVDQSEVPPPPGPPAGGIAAPPPPPF